MNATTALVRRRPSDVSRFRHYHHHRIPCFAYAVVFFHLVSRPEFTHTYVDAKTTMLYTLLIPYARNGDHNMVAEESAECLGGGGSSSGVASAFRIHTHRARAGGRSPHVSLVPHEDCTGAVVVVFFRRRTGYIFLRERTRTLL